MNIIENIVDIVRNASLRNLDTGVVTMITGEEIYKKAESNPEYRALVDSFKNLYEDAIKKGVSPNHAVAVVLSTQENMIRYVIMKCVKDYLTALGAEDIEALKRSFLYNDMTKKIETAGSELARIEEKTKALVSNNTVEQFKYSLEYAADRWGSETEKKAVKGLISKINGAKRKADGGSNTPNAETTKNGA